jgi:hypothetical protein
VVDLLMVRVRRLIGPIAALWLILQVAGTSVVSIEAITLDESECTCLHGEHAMCPMHHKLPAGRCAMRPSADTGAAVLASVLIAPALMPAVSCSSPSLQATRVAPLDNARLALTPTHPDPPPPRA